MEYNLDTEALTILSYRDILKKQNLLPGRRILHQNIDENFDILQRLGINNVSQLIKKLSSSFKISMLAKDSGIDEHYLIILKREISSLEQKPVLLSMFPGVDSSIVKRLNDNGIKNSKQYWQNMQATKDELFCLCDLVRINGIGPVAARAFYEAGYRSVLDIKEADAMTMLEQISIVNAEHHFYKTNLGLKDMQFCIDFARFIMND